MAPSTYGSSVWNLLHVARLVRRILTRFPDFLKKIDGPVAVSILQKKKKGSLMFVLKEVWQIDRFQQLLSPAHKELVSSTATSSV